MTKTEAVTTHTREQKAVIRRLQTVTSRMAVARDRLSELTERRRQLLMEAYSAGIDTVQLGGIIGTSAETVRKNLEPLGGLRGAASEKAKEEPSA